MKNNKKKYIIVISTIVWFIIFSGVCLYFLFNKYNNIKNIYLDKDNNIIIELSSDYETYCYVGNDLNNVKWVSMKDNKCIIEYSDSKYIYLRNKFNNIKRYDNKDLSKVLSISVNKDKIYLAIGGINKINVSYEVLGKVDSNILYKSLDDSVASVSSDGVVTGIKSGNTKIMVSLDSISEYIDVLVTDKISTYGEYYDYNRSYLSCGMYSKSDNDLLDEILLSRVNEAGYKTRAGVLAAVRFLTLEFPYRISYFSENGRLHPYGAGSVVDGEGRYYHKGLYLNNSRYQSIESSMYGPATWGCEIYSFPSEEIRKNGFDCSGFISWIVYNGGFECEDLGAGVSTIPDMTDLGKKIKLTDAVNNNSIRAGDLISGHGIDGGHIAIVAGIKDNKYYIAESLWYAKPYNGALIKEYTKEALVSNFYWHVDMNDYYKEDGNYTEYWSY